MKTINLISGLCIITVLLFNAKSSFAQNQLNLNTQYPVWHYFDDALGNLGIDPYVFSDAGNFFEPNTIFCNRGIGATIRWALSLDDTNAVYRYDISDLDSNGWYVIQIDGDYKVEMSTDNANWTTELSADTSVPWSDKGPGKNMSAYYVDLKSYLPADNLYVKFSDKGLSGAQGANVYNALITEFGYPNFYAGGGEPQNGPGGQYIGDQQFLFVKDWTSDREAGGRYADGDSFFVYKFDLPDDNDDCELIAYIAQQYKLDISTKWNFSDVFYTTQSLDQSGAPQRICINLKSMLENSSDNVVYFRMGDAMPSNGWGGLLTRLWIAPQISADGIKFKPMDEIENAFRWDNYECGFISAWAIRYTDLDHTIAYRLNLGPDVSAYTYITIETAGGYLWQGSSNGVDWVDLFIGPDDGGGGPAEMLVVHPFTGVLNGAGAQPGVPNLINPSYEGWSNVFFLKLKNSAPEGGNGGQMRSIEVVSAPPPEQPPINTIYPVWHYFDPLTDFDSKRIGGDYYKSGGGSGTTGPSTGGFPNRGTGTPGRYAMFVDAGGQLTMKYPMDITDEQGWYVLQVDNQFSVELSNDGETWTTPLTPDPSVLSPETIGLNWFNKGITNMAPYYFDLAALGLLPTSNIYVKLADSVPTTGWGSRAWNALITKRGYPSFFGGGNEPDTSGLIGDQQFLFTKTGSVDRENDGRFADAANTCSYKFDLPDGEDDCTLHARINGDFLMGISTDYLMCIDPNYQFTANDIVVSNTTGNVATNFNFAISLSGLLAETDDNLIYTYFADLTTSSGWGPNIMDFWITKHQVLTQAFVNAATEEELPFLWQSTRSQVNVAENGTRSRQVTGWESFVYMFQIKDIIDVIAYNFEVGNEYAIDVSTNIVDWFNIFNAVANEPKGGVSYNPYTAEAIGAGAVSNVPGFYLPGDSQNQIYFRFRDSIGGDEIPCSVYKAWTGEAIPEPGLVFGLVLALTALIKRRVK